MVDRKYVEKEHCDAAAAAYYILHQKKYSPEYLIQNCKTH